MIKGKSVLNVNKNFKVTLEQQQVKLLISVLNATKNFKFDFLFIRLITIIYKNENKTIFIKD